MFATLRQFISKFFVTIFVVLLIASFAVWGIADSIGVAGDPKIAVVGSTPIYKSELDLRVQSQMRQYQLRGIEVPEEMTNVLEQQMFQSMVSQTYLTEKAEDYGVLVGKDVMIAHIQNDPQFFTSTGQFNQDNFNRTLNALGYNEKQYQEALQKELTIWFLTSSIAKGGVLPKSYAAYLTNYEAEQRSALLLELKPEFIKTVPNPTDAELLRFFESNKQDFVDPEYRDVSFITMGVDQILDELDLSEERLKQAYEENVAAYSTPARRKIYQLLFESETEANKAVKAIKSSKSFEKTAKAIQGYADGSYDLGEMTEEQLGQGGLVSEDIVQKVFELPVKTVSDAMDGPLGWYVYYVPEAKKGSVKSYEEVKSSLKQAVIQSDAEPILYDFVMGLDDAMAGGATLEEVAKQFNLTLGKVDQVSEAGKKLNGSPTKNIPAFGEFYKQAYNTPEQELSDIVSADDGLSYYVLRVDGVTPARQMTLDEVRGSVVNAWKAQRKIQLLEEEAKKMALELNELVTAGKSTKAIKAAFAKKASSKHIELHDEKPFTRRDTSEGKWPFTLTDELFKLKEGRVTNAHGHGDVFVIGLVTGVTEAQGQQKQGIYQSVSAQIEEQAANDMLSQFVEYLRNQYPAKIMN